MLRLVLFSKRPLLGHVKTRLVPPLTPEQALELHQAFLLDQIRFLRSFEGTCELELCVDGSWSPAPEFGRALEGLAITTQGEGGLDRRLLRTFQRAADRGSTGTLILGADAPTLPAGHVSEALRALDRGADAVACPAEDGGYVMIGMARPIPELLRDVPWGGPRVMHVTRERAAGAGRQLVEIDGWYDVDDASDLRRLRRELTGGAADRRAPETARFLARYPAV